ncbi:hypothetical protein AWZ03_001218 [Drosophila navojoa]|uniref:EB domain-containing protein n=1 Tax=Drosophila navojoa TaxID=7232 RepID=A0A484BUC0_DRONA|nr:hypothetical protein AWZ03_001218 [Drosophila navojoa]
MRLDGALEPRHGAATLQSRFIGVAKYRRETRVKCELQQQQCADEDDEAAAAAIAATAATAAAAAVAVAAATVAVAVVAPATAKHVNNNYSSNNNQSNNNNNNSNSCRWEQQAQHLSPTQAPSTTTTATTTKQVNLHLSNLGATAATAGVAGAAGAALLTTAATLKMRVEHSLMLMAPWIGGGQRMVRMGCHSANNVLRLISVLALLLLPPLPLALADDGDNFFAVNSFSVGPETTTPEFDYASRGQKKFGDKCENTLECGFPGSICDPKKKSCQCTEDLQVTNHIDKCGKAAAINESCFFNEQCEAIYFQTECRDGRCICRFEMLPIWGKDGSVECKGRQDKRGPETYIDPAMIGVLVGMALMFIIICVVLRLFSQARWHENRTIFNTPNPRLMNVSLLRDNKLLHGQDRRGSRMSVRAPSRQPSMASLRPHSPNPSLGKTGRMIRSKSNTRSSDSRVSDVSNCSRLLEHPSAASQYNVVHSHFLPYVPTTTSAATTYAAPATATATATATASATAAASATATVPATQTPTPTPASSIIVTTTYVSSPGTAPACGMTANPDANKF